jgi:presqualene diphosphate synthase
VAAVADTQKETTQETAAGRASGSSFYAAMRIMPREQREAMFEIYSFCRRVDDIADSPGPRDERLDQLNRWRADIDAIYAGKALTKARSLATPIRQFGLKREDFLAVIDGMEMDVVADVRAPDWNKLDLYCDRVASAVGRLSVRVFGLEEKAGVALAYHLGRALQLTNILRDIDEDAGIGRLYLPREALQQAGILTSDPKTVVSDPRLPQVCEQVIERARGHFAEADRIMERCPRKAVRTPRIMEAAYKAILDELVARGFTPPRRPIRVKRARLLWIILRYAFI